MLSVITSTSKYTSALSTVSAWQNEINIHLFTLNMLFKNASLKILERPPLIT